MNSRNGLENKFWPLLEIRCNLSNGFPISLIAHFEFLEFIFFLEVVFFLWLSVYESKMEPSGIVKRTGFPVQGSSVQNHWLAPSLTQPFILLRSMKSGPHGDLVVKNKLSPCSGTVALRQLNPTEFSLINAHSLLNAPLQ